jgi:hypothetical protein
MCYSFEASMNAGVGLGIAGVAMVAKALRSDRRLVWFAAFPLVFSVHQFVEAVNWRAYFHPFRGDEAFRYLYTMIAFLVWPVLTPIAAWRAETNPSRRALWRALCGCGVALSVYLSAKLAYADGIDVSVVDHSLAYDPLFERPPLIAHFTYVALTVIPLVSMDNRALKIFGALVFATFVYSIVEARAAWYSVWCMAAAMFSFTIAFAFEREQRRDYREAKV